MRYSESTLQAWTAPLSLTEEKRVENTIRMIRDAIKSSEELSDCTIEVFAQGSYANNTNVRQNSDIDVCVMLTSTFYAEYVNGKTREDYGFLAGGMKYSEYKAKVFNALVKKFGLPTLSLGNKSIKIASNSYHVNADVVPAMQYRDYRIINSVDPNRFVEGIQFTAKDNSTVINYPKIHISNGKEKNVATNHEYKKLVRIMKHVRNDMVDCGLVDGEIYSSFLMECLIWNIPNNEIEKFDTWTMKLRNAIYFLWKEINDGNFSDWGEVSECLYLFRGRKWNALGTMQFLQSMFDYLKFE